MFGEALTKDGNPYHIICICLCVKKLFISVLCLYLDSYREVVQIAGVVPCCCFSVFWVCVSVGLRIWERGLKSHLGV